ncbi:MAG TPA: hypothetical protein VF720_13245, partial [Candidatus Eisenbacteria bacterium]
FRSEGVRNTWQLPVNTDPARWLPEQVESTGFFVEGAWRALPIVTLGGRYDRIDFDEIESPTGRRDTWDANVRRWEGAVAWHPSRDWEIKVSYQDWMYPDDEHLDADMAGFQLRMEF